MEKIIAHGISICWLRRDLRLNDNHALYQALKSGYPVLPVFIFDTGILDKLPDKKDKRITFFYKILKEINKTLQHHGSSLLALKGTCDEVFSYICSEFPVKEVFTNHDYEPYAIERDECIRKLLADKNIPFHTFKDQVVFERSEVMKADGSPYTIFTPYSNTWKQKISEQEIFSFPSEKLLSHLLKTKPFYFPTIGDIGFELSGTEPLFLRIDKNTIENYSHTRNLPALNATSHASVHLRFGTVSIRHLTRIAQQWSEIWLNELIWREFFMMILFHFPDVIHHSFKKKYDNIQWRNNEKEFKQWCKGKTGYPIVDAGMRELNKTGFMHNRVRMIVASFLTKNLLIDWRWGEAYFAEKLLDYELSSNNGNWQWAAGSGCDATPYFRIFNPMTQREKFDPENHYVKKWVPELGTDKYPLPVVDYKLSREKALEVYKEAVKE